MTEPRTTRQFIRKEIRRISNASTTEERIALEEALENYIVSLTEKVGRLREYILDEVGPEHLPVELGGELE